MKKYRIHKSKIEADLTRKIINVESTKGMREIYALTPETSKKIHQEVLAQYPDDIEKYALSSDKHDVLDKGIVTGLSVFTFLMATGITHNMPISLISTLTTLSLSTHITTLAKEKRREKIKLLEACKEYVFQLTPTTWAFNDQKLFLPKEIMEEPEKVKRFLNNQKTK